MRCRLAATASGLACTTQAPQLAYPDLIRSFTALARTHDLTILDAEPISLAVDRRLIDPTPQQPGRGSEIWRTSAKALSSGSRR
jgi:hypothetical protein